MIYDGFELGLYDINNVGVYVIGNEDVVFFLVVMCDVGLCICWIDLVGCSDKCMLLMWLVVQLDFLFGFGGNWDVFVDSLCDLQWLLVNGYVLFFNDVDDLCVGVLADFDMLLDILDEVSVYWSGQNVLFWVFVVLQDVVVEL